METEENSSSLLATTVHLKDGIEISTSDQDAAQAVAAGLRDAKAANTRRAYASAWHTFCDWTILTGRQAMPAAPQSVALYLGHLAAGAKLWPPSIWPGPPSPTPTPLRGYPRPRTPPVIRSWPKL